MSAAIVGALVIAAVSTLGDGIWAAWIPEHRPVYGLIHGTLLLACVGFYLGLTADRRFLGLLGGAIVGFLAAGSFYLLRSVTGYWTMFVAWFALWFALAAFDGMVLRRRAAVREIAARGIIAAAASAVAFYAVSGIWFPFRPHGWDYAVHFASWTVAYLPAFLALLAGPRVSGQSLQQGGKMARISVALLAVLSLGTTGAAAEPQAGRTPASASAAPRVNVNDRFAGAWKVVSIERLGPNGAALPAAEPPAFGSPNPTGFLIYDPAGYMTIDIMQSGRQKYAGRQPTGDEARMALASYISYYGAFTVDEASRVVTHHVQGNLIPGLGPDQKRPYSFEFSGNRLTLKTTPGPTGAQSRLTFERVPDLPELTPMHRRFVGFYKLVSNERRDTTGKVVSSNVGQTGFIIYTASGIMAAHLMQPDRKRYAAAQPTGEEAVAALATYLSYFGRYTIHDREGFVVHHRAGALAPGDVGSDLQRFYEFSGRRLVLKPPPTEVDGKLLQSFITWERLSADRSTN